MLPALEGDTVLVITPQGQTLLLDGGSDGAALAAWLGKRLPFGQRRIDALVLTRPDTSTLPGQLAAIKRYEIGTALVAPIEPQTNEMAAWRQALVEQGTAIQLLAQGSQLKLGTCLMDVLTADRGRATFALQCGATSAYFLQAIDDAAEAVLESQSQPQASLVVYPWERTTDTALLQRLQPSALVFSEGGDETVQQSFAQRQIGAAHLFHEDVHGEITLASDGDAMHIHTERKEAR